MKYLCQEPRTLKGLSLSEGATLTRESLALS
jgi:hypothetical protein